MANRILCYTLIAFLALLVFLYHPLCFLLGFLIITIHLYLLHEHLFHASLVERAKNIHRQLPTRGEFLDKGVRHIMALIDDDCIVCRDQPVAPIQVLPCEHIFCQECYVHYLNHGLNRCPQCQQVLFETDSLMWEAIVKLITAHVFVALRKSLASFLFIIIHHEKAVADQTTAC